MALGRESLRWSAEAWNLLDRAVHDEFVRTGIAGTIVPLHGPLPGAVTVPADVINRETMTVDESATHPIVELSVSFGLRQEQVEGDPQLSTAITLAARAANLLSQAEDILVFQGDSGKTSRIFESVVCRGHAGRGLLAPSDPVVHVEALEGTAGYGERTFQAVVDGRADLQARGHYGPYALALSSDVYADTFAPLPGTLAMPADRIRPLVTQGFVGCGALPPATGVLLSVGGDTVDIAVGSDPATAFTQVDTDGVFHFRVFERFALRIKDDTALVAMRFAAVS